MHLVGDLSSVRLREELIPLLSERRRGMDAWAACSNWAWLVRSIRNWPPGRRRSRLSEGSIPWWRSLALGAEVISWRLRLTAITRNMSHDELYMWLDKLKLKRSDSEVVRQGVVLGPLWRRKWPETNMSDWEIYKALRKTSVEALVFALASAGRRGDAAAAAPLPGRHTAPGHQRDGRRSLGLGMKRDPAVGRILEKVKEMRVEGKIQGREAELEAARATGGRIQDEHRWQYLIPWSILLVLSMMLHEIAHGWVAYRLGDPTAKIARPTEPQPPEASGSARARRCSSSRTCSGGFIFGWAKPIPVSPYYFKNRQRGMAIVGAAGPLTNFVIAVIFGRSSLCWAGPSSAAATSRRRVLTILFLAFQVNVVLGLFNLIPIPPLDGSRVLGASFPGGL